MDRTAIGANEVGCASSVIAFALKAVKLFVKTAWSIFLEIIGFGRQKRCRKWVTSISADNLLLEAIL